MKVEQKHYIVLQEYSPRSNYKYEFIYRTNDETLSKTFNDKEDAVEYYNTFIESLKLEPIKIDNIK